MNVKGTYRLFFLVLFISIFFLKKESSADTISMPNFTISAGQRVTVPLNGYIPSGSIEGIEVNITYDPNMVNIANDSDVVFTIGSPIIAEEATLTQDSYVCAFNRIRSQSPGLQTTSMACISTKDKPAGTFPIANVTFTGISATNGSTNIGFDCSFLTKITNPDLTTSEIITYPPLTVVATTTPFIPTFAIAASSGLNGTVSPLGNVTVNQGTNQTFTITPNYCYRTNSILVNNVRVATASSYTFLNVNANNTISATFAKKTFSINATAGANGTVYPLNYSVANCGSSPIITITPNVGYKIADVLVDNISVGTPTSYQFLNVTANHTLRAVFTLK